MGVRLFPPEDTGAKRGGAMLDDDESSGRVVASAILSIAFHGLVVAGIVKSGVMANLLFDPDPPPARTSYHVLELAPPERVTSPFRLTRYQAKTEAAVRPAPDPSLRPMAAKQTSLELPAPPKLSAFTPPGIPDPLAPPLPAAPAPPPPKTFRPPPPKETAEAPPPRQVLIQDAPRVTDLDKVQVPSMILAGTVLKPKVVLRPPDQREAPKEAALSAQAPNLRGSQPAVSTVNVSPLFKPPLPTPQPRQAPIIGAAGEDAPAVVSSLPGTDSQAVKLISQSSRPVPLSPSIAIPSVSVGQLQPAGNGAASNGAPSSTAAQQPGPTAAAASPRSGAGKEGSPGTSASGRGSPPFSIVGSPGAPALPAAAAAPLTSAGRSDVVRIVRTAKPDLMVAQSESAIPGSAGILNCRPVFSVFISLDTPKDWVLQYCLPSNRPADDGRRNGNVVQMAAPTPVTPPYATVIVRPKLEFFPGLRYAFVHGFVNELGRFELLTEGGQGAIKGPAAALESLAQWEFLPAKKDGVPARVEVLLCIPNA